MEAGGGDSEKSKHTGEGPKGKRDGVEHGDDSFEDENKYDDEYRESTKFDCLEIRGESIVHGKVCKVCSCELKGERVADGSGLILL